MEVICINAEFNSFVRQTIPNLPEEERVYTIRDSFPTRNGMAVHLVEIENPKIGYPTLENSQFFFEPSFSASRFTTLLGESLTAESFKRVNHDY